MLPTKNAAGRMTRYPLPKPRPYHAHIDASAIRTPPVGKRPKKMERNDAAVIIHSASKKPIPKWEYDFNIRAKLIVIAHADPALPKIEKIESSTVAVVRCTPILSSA